MTPIEPPKSINAVPVKLQAAKGAPTASPTNNSTKLILEKIAAPDDGRPLTLNITLAPAPPAKVEWYENGIILAAAIGFFGVVLTILLGHWKMRKELGQALTLAKGAQDYSRQQADEDRRLASEQANKERQHSADEAHHERIATSRRSVYLETVRRVVVAHGFLGSLIKRKRSINHSLVS